MPVDTSIFHAFGCPCFVLDSRLQSGISAVPKWEPRARLGIYIGHSPSHAGSVALVLNPRTGHVSPQYHVVFDERFSTVPYLGKDSVPPNWAELVETAREDASEDEIKSAQLWYEQNKSLNETAGLQNHTMKAPTTDQQWHEQTTPLIEPTNLQNYTMEVSIADHTEVAPQTNDQPTTGPPQSEPSKALQDLEIPTVEALKINHNEGAPQMIDLATTGLRRSDRIRAL